MHIWQWCLYGHMHSSEYQQFYNLELQIIVSLQGLSEYMQSK